jgi:ankyrin repeat protein
MALTFTYFFADFRFPSLKLAMLFIECGADVDGLDYDGNTSLHMIAGHPDAIRDFEVLSGIIQVLLASGCHFDTVNKDGLTAAQYAVSGEIIDNPSTALLNIKSV